MSKRRVFILNNDNDDLVVVNRGSRINRHERHSRHHESNSTSNTTCSSSSSSSSHKESSSSGSSLEFRSSSPSTSSSFSFGPTGPEGPVGPTGPGKSVLFWNSGVNTPNVDEPYIGWGYTTSSSQFASIIIPYDGTIRNLYAQAPGNSGCTGVVTAYVNGAPTSLTNTGNGTTFSNTVDSASVNANDLVSIHFVISGQCTTGTLASVELDA